MSTNATNVYVQGARALAVNTAVGLLMDNSGSMVGAKHECQRALAVTLTEACKMADVDCAVTALARTYSGAGATIIKNWHQPLVPALQAICDTPTDLGCTPLARGIMASVDHLAARPRRTKRILLALTDGMSDEGAPAVKLACDYGRSRGVHVIGVLIQSDEKGFPTSIQVDDPSDLSRAVLDRLVDELRAQWVAR